jgi:hypothetical protein
MKLVIFGLTISSSWGNGHATVRRGLCAALARRGHQVVFFDRVQRIIGSVDKLCVVPLGAFADDEFSLLFFPVEHPEFFDAVLTDECGNIKEIHVKHPAPRSNWIWDAFKMPDAVFTEQHYLWREERRGSIYRHVGQCLSRCVRTGCAVRAGQAYFDVGTLMGYREALRLLSPRPPSVEVPVETHK